MRYDRARGARNGEWSRRVKSFSGSSRTRERADGAIPWTARFSPNCSRTRGFLRSAAVSRTGEAMSTRRHRASGGPRGLMVRQRRQRGRSASTWLRLSGRYLRRAACLNSEALSVNSSTLTCVGPTITDRLRLLSPGRGFRAAGRRRDRHERRAAPRATSLLALEAAKRRGA